MRKLILGFILIAGAATLAAQDFDAGKAMKKASRLVSSYSLDPINNAEKIVEAKDLIDQVLASGELNEDTKMWYTYGTVYMELLNKDVQALVNDQEAPIMHRDSPSKIYRGYAKAYETAEKNFEKRDAVSGMTGIMNNMAYIASIELSRSEFADSYASYNSLIMTHDFLTSKNEDSFYESEDDFLQQVYWAALAAFSAQDLTEANKQFKRLYDANYDSPDIYSALADIATQQGDDAAAEQYLSEGVKRYPDDKGLLYSEINRALAKGELETLIGKLETAMEKEPDNYTIPSTLGHVYDQLYQDAVKAEDHEKADLYYEKAKESFGIALEMDENYFDALYMMGALEYNKAAELATEVNALAEDYSKEGTAKYELKKTEMMAQFDKALPYFTKAESVNPDDINTLIALREIYARKDMLDKSAEYKAKIEGLQPGSNE